MGTVGPINSDDCKLENAALLYIEIGTIILNKIFKFIQFTSSTHTLGFQKTDFGSASYITFTDTDIIHGNTNDNNQINLSYDVLKLLNTNDTPLITLYDESIFNNFSISYDNLNSIDKSTIIQNHGNIKGEFPSFAAYNLNNNDNAINGVSLVFIENVGSYLTI